MSGRSGGPRSKRGPPPQRWFQERRSEYPWEQDGLDHIKRLMPDAEPYRAWATFSFTAASGRINECDLLIAVPGGLYLLELKAHPGRVVNHGDTWRFQESGSSRIRTLRNPLHFTDLKTKDLKSRLEWAARRLKISARVPRVEPAVFLSDPGLHAALDDVQATRVYGRDDAAQGLPWIWRDLLSRPPQREPQRITPEFSRHVLPTLLDEIGLRVSTAHLRFGDDWSLAPTPLDVGPTWEDRLAERHGIVRESGRVRIYLTEQQDTDERRQSVERGARREYQVLQGITHRGIAQAVQIREHQGGPAILFRHEVSDQRLDSYLAVHGERLTPETRLDLVRQLAEAVRYAHSRSLYHRALAARSVYVSAKEDGSAPVLRVIDWQAAARDFDTTVSSSLGATSLGGEHVADAAELYLAPEFGSPFPDPVDLDVFGLGAVAYLIVTGEPPAPTRSALIEKLTADHGLHPYAVADAIGDALDELIFYATRSDSGERLDSAEGFIERLDAIEQEVAVPEPGADPLTAAPGQVLDGGWEVARVLGTGATSRALLVERRHESEDGEEEVERRVLKVALDEDKAASLRAEARALDVVGGGAIVKKLDGPRVLGGRTVLDLQYAGGADDSGRTLGALLRAEGRLSYHDLERFGGDLFTALDQLAARGVRHRDLKPDNFVVFRRADRSRQLMLLDFSLAAASERDITAGTRSYLDPFLGSARRPMFDDHAERYAAAVTLHEMASTSRPVWGDGMTDPRTTDDEAPTLAPELFDPALRDELVAFFLRAFHREVDRRFDTFRQMEEAWRGVFVASDAASPVTTPATVGLDPRSLEETRAAAARAATVDTPLDAAGLSPRAVSVAQSFGATTVDELLDVPLHQIAKARGAGAVIRKEINRRHKQWAVLRAVSGGRAGSGDPMTVEGMAALLATPVARKSSKKADVVRLTLGLPNGTDAPESWATQAEIAKRLDLTQASVSRHQQAAAKDWAAMSWLSVVRDDLVYIVRGAGRVMAAHELAAALRARRGAGDDDPDATMARAEAVVRAAAEAESWAGHHPEDPATDDAGPRLAVLRRGGRVLLACESLPDTEDPSAAELADYAQTLGRRADELAAAEPMPGRGVVVRELRAVPAPDGLAPLADTRLVSLAAAVSHDALVSPRLELYPRGIDLVTALRVSQAAAGVRRQNGITADDLLTRVRSRFPEIHAAGLTHIRIEDALKDAGFPLEYDPTDRRFRPPAPDGPQASLSSTSTTLGRTFVISGNLHDVLRKGLNAAIDHGGFLALTLRGRNLPGAAAAIASAYPVLPVDLNAMFLAEFRALVTDRGQDWGKVLTIDARFGETGRMSPGLASYVRTCWTKVEDALAERAGDGVVLFLHDAGLLARYADTGGHELLVRLQNAARRPNEAPHGLWLLCPADSAVGTPQLDGHLVEVVDGSERLVLDGGFLDGLRGGAGTAA